MRLSAGMCWSFQMPRSDGRNAALGHDRGGFDHHQARAALGAAAEMHEMPVGREAVWAEYWHIGDTPMRLAKVTERSCKGEKRGWLIKSRSRPGGPKIDKCPSIIDEAADKTDAGWREPRSQAIRNL